MNNFSIRHLIRFCIGNFILLGILLNRPPESVDLNLANLQFGLDFNHTFGCDRLGRDNWALFAYGSISTILICIPARVLTICLAFLFSFFAYAKQKKLILLTDTMSAVFLALPSLLVALVAIALLPDSQATIIIAIVLSDWAVSYESLQGKLREVEKSGYVIASLSLGARPGQIFVYHFIPALGQMFEYLFITGIPAVIMTIALFSYLGVNSSLFEWGPGLGEQIAFSKDYFEKSPVSVLLPILGVIGLVYSFGRDS